MQYVDTKDKNKSKDKAKDKALSLRRCKLLSSNYYNINYKDYLVINLSLIINKCLYKFKRLLNKLQSYYNAIRSDLYENHLLLHGDPLRWWLTRGKSSYPILYKIALDFLTILATSCECERCFSAAGRTVTNNYNYLLGATIKAIQLQKHWIKHQIVRSELLALATHVTRENSLTGSHQALDPASPIV